MHMKTNKELLMELVSIMDENGEVSFDSYRYNKKDDEIVYFLKENILDTNYCDQSYKDEVLKFLSDNELMVDDFETVFDERTEGGGDYDGWETVVRVRDQYFAFYGWYSSHEGTEMTWDECYEVEPKQVTTTVYMKVK